MTYYKDDALWMTNEYDKYSFYGTDENGDLTNGIVNAIGDTVNTVAIKGISMEDYYITMRDIKAKINHSWTYNNGVYSSSNSEVIEWFKAFTAPCYLGFDQKTKNYILFDRVEIEENENELILRLIANSQEYSKLSSDNEVFSQAVVSYSHVSNGEGKVIETQDAYKEGIIEYTCKECKKKYEDILTPIYGTEIDTYPGISNQDVITYQGVMYLYGGNLHGKGRTNNIYCYNINNNKMYLLDVKLNLASTSHRALLKDDKVYIFGGYTNDGRTNRIEIHDIKNNKVELLDTTLPFNINCFQIGVYQDRMYVLGGSNSTDGINSKIYKIDLKTFEYQLLDVELPVALFKGAWTTNGEYSYVVGGINSSRLNSFYRFNMKTHEIETLDVVLPKYLCQSRLTCIDDELYIVGGTDNNGLVDNVYVYDINTRELEELKYKLPVTLANTCLSNYKNKLYIVAGNDYIDDVILRLDEDGFINLTN